MDRIDLACGGWLSWDRKASMAATFWSMNLLMSPKQFEDLVYPSLKRQVSHLDCSLYHLDGKDAIKHLDAVLDLEDLDALQWTAGGCEPDGSNVKWYSIYDQARKAGQALWISIEDGGIEEWIRGARNIVERYGTTGIYLRFPVMQEKEADRLLNLIG